MKGKGKAKARIPHFAASVRSFSNAVSEGRARTTHLRGPTSHLTQDPEAIRQALEELRLHQEELAVADEELRAQVAEMANASGRAQVERDRYRELFDVAPDGYFITDRLAVVRDVNAAGAELLAIKPHFLIGKPLIAMVDAADARTMRDAINTLRTKTTVEIEVRLKPRNHEPVWHTIRATAIEGGAALLWVARDVQLNHAVTDALASSHDGLEILASQRERELERANRDKEEILARERHLRTQLESAHAAKDRFLGVLSHDLRAPINSVLGWTQLLRREKLDQTSRDRALATIERNARAQLRLLEGLLDISRTSEANERAPIDVRQVVQSTADALAAEMQERAVHLEVSLCEEPLVVAADRRRLEQIATNLLSNAVKFSPREGRVVLTVTRHEDRARIVVEDTGRGIARERLSQVFDPFRKFADYTTDERIGLGLYIVRQAVEMHGGSIVAESEGVGRGARFIVELPTLAPPYSRALSWPTERPPEPSQGEANGDGSGPDAKESLEGIRVLVVDDDEDARDLMAAVLRQRGAVVTLASDVSVALGAFDAAPPDVVVSDIAMPTRDGFELARELRGRPGGSAALIAVSGFASSESVDRALKAGFDLHLSKPLEPADLVDAVLDAVHANAKES